MFWPDLSQAPFHRALAMFDAGRPSPRINIAGARSGPASTGIRSPGADRPASSGRHAVRPWYWPRYTGMRIGPTENRNGAPPPPITSCWSGSDISGGATTRPRSPRHV